MNDKQLRAFQLVAEEHSLNRAANRAFTSVQTLKKQLDSLERELQVKLLIRSHKGTTLTLEGQRFAEGLRELVPQFDKLITEIHDEQVRDEIVICFPNNLFIESVEHICECFESLNPQIKFRFAAMNPSKWLQAIHDAQADLCVFTNVPEIGKLDLMTTAIDFPIKLMCVMTKDQLLATAGKVSIEELSQMNVVVNNTNNYRDLLTLLDYGEVATVAADKLSILDFCRSGGIYIMTEIDPVEMRPLVCVPLAFEPEPRLWVYRKGSPSYLQQFVEFAKKSRKF